MTHFEWAHTSEGPTLVDPAELSELADDGNPTGAYGVAFGECMLWGSLEELHAMAVRIGLMVEAAQRKLTKDDDVCYDPACGWEQGHVGPCPEPLGPPNPAHGELPDPGHCLDCLQPRNPHADRHCRATSTRTVRTYHRWSND